MTHSADKSQSIQRLVFLALARDCDPYIANFIRFLESLQSEQLAASAIIGENGSSDRTRELLSTAAREGAPIEVVDTGFMSREPRRLKRMAIGREHLKQRLADAGQQPDYVGVIDLDNVMMRPPPASAIADAIQDLAQSEKYFAYSASSQPTYYDLLALRCAEFDAPSLYTQIEIAKSNPFHYYRFMRSNVYDRQRLVSENGVTDCTSAFNGVCLYRWSEYEAASYLDPRNATVCEHVILNEQIHSRTNAHVKIDPRLCLATPPDHAPQGMFTFYGSRLRKMLASKLVKMLPVRLQRI